MSATLPIVVAALALLSIAISPKAKSNEGFYSGFSPKGQAPSLFTLVLSQVTTWIFARSLLNAAILGFYYGIWGTIAYAAYYLSFLTGAAIVDSIRFKHGFNSVQSFLEDRFGKLGTHCYNFVVGLRLISEVFANILVIGILFGAAGTSSYTIAVVAFAAIAMIYSMLGGLHASLKTDVMQMLIFIAVLTLLVVSALGDGLYSIEALSFVEFDVTNPGPILLAVALLQVWSYPLHDPVMMDRGFIADRDTTKRSFLHAAWISILCILAFGSLGIIAGANALDGDSMNVTLERILGDNMMLLFNIALVVSALSTLDSTLSSSAKLVVVDMKVMAATIANGRIVMLTFMILGVAMVFLGNKDIFSAVAVSGTASMYLTPVIFFCIWADNEHISPWAYLCSFISAIGGAALYFTESSGHTALLGDAHKYTKLLWISLSVLAIGCTAFFTSLIMNKPRAQELSGV